MWEPRRLTNLLTCTAYYRDSCYLFTFYSQQIIQELWFRDLKMSIKIKEKWYKYGGNVTNCYETPLNISALLLSAVCVQLPWIWEKIGFNYSLEIWTNSYHPDEGRHGNMNLLSRDPKITDKSHLKCRKFFIWFEAFTAVTMKNVVFWSVALYRSWVNWRFGGTYSLHLQGRKILERWTSVSRWLQTEPPVGTTSYIRAVREGV
jgi:hypothetical protein